MNIDQKLAVIMAAVRSDGNAPPEAIPLIEMAATELLSISESLRSIASSIEFLCTQGKRQ